MTELRLPRVPDRTPIKLTISVMPDLNRALSDYAVVYKAAYGEEQAIVDLIPHMLAAFLAADRGFAKARDAMVASAK